MVPLKASKQASRQALGEKRPGTRGPTAEYQDTTVYSPFSYDDVLVGRLGPRQTIQKFQQTHKYFTPVRGAATECLCVFTGREIRTLLDVGPAGGVAPSRRTIYLYHTTHHRPPAPSRMTSSSLLSHMYMTIARALALVQNLRSGCDVA